MAREVYTRSLVLSFIGRISVSVVTSPTALEENFSVSTLWFGGSAVYSLKRYQHPL